MKRTRSILVAVVALAGVSLLPVPSAQAGTRVSVNIGTGYYSRPGYYQPRPYYARPVVYRPAYYPQARYPRYYNQGHYYNRAPVYYNRGPAYYNSRPVYYYRR